MPREGKGTDSFSTTRTDKDNAWYLVVVLSATAPSGVALHLPFFHQIDFSLEVDQFLIADPISRFCLTVSHVIFYHGPLVPRFPANWVLDLKT